MIFWLRLAKSDRRSSAGMPPPARIGVFQGGLKGIDQMLHSRNVLIGFAVLALGVVGMKVAPPNIESSDLLGEEKAASILDRNSEGHSDVEIVVKTSKATRPITVMYGSLSDFAGEEILELGEKAWLVFDGTRASLVLELSDSTLVAYHNNRSEPTIATFVDFNPLSVMARAMEVADGSFPCGANENQCQCIAIPEQTCSGVGILSMICCAADQFCGCKVIEDTKNNCILAVKAVCIDPPE